MNLRAFGGVAATTGLLVIGGVCTAAPASASAPAYSTVTASGCDTTTGTQWVTWAPTVQGGAVQPLNDDFFVQEAYGTDGGEWGDITPSVAFRWDDPTISVTGIPGATIEGGMIIRDEEGHLASLSFAGLAGDCAVVAPQPEPEPVDPGVPADPGTPAAPETPTEPETPVVPEAPVEPAAPVDPATPAAQAAVPTVPVSASGASATPAGHTASELASTGADIPAPLIAGAVLLTAVGSALALRRPRRADQTS